MPVCFMGALRSVTGMTQNKRDDPVGMAPPLISLAALFIGLGLDQLLPIGFAEVFAPRTPRAAVAAFVGAVAIWIGIREYMVIRRVNKPVNRGPGQPVATLVMTGIYASTRNPMYQCQGLLLLALAVRFASDWTLLLLIPWALVMHFGVVLREERYLEELLGDEYRHYKKHVPRYGWPF